MSARCVFGQADLRRIEEAYTARRWGVEDGLPEGIVTSVVQFPDGFIWLTTPRHVIRFDGVEFLPCAQASYPADKPKKFNRIMRDRQGRVWVSGENGVMRRDGDVWHKVLLAGPRTSASGPEVFWVAERPDGTVWAASSAGMYRFDGQVFRLLPFRQDDDLGKICSAAMDARGVFWLTEERGLVSCNGKSYTRERAPPDAAEQKNPSLVFCGGGKTVWYKLDTGKLFKREADVWQEVPPPGLRVQALLEQPTEIWLGAVEGLYLRRGEQWLVFPDAAALGNRAHDIRCLEYTKNGMVWVGCGNGLLRIMPRVVQLCQGAHGLQPQRVTSLLHTRDEQFWVGLADCGLWQGSPDSLKRFMTVPDVLAGTTVSALLADGDERVWAGTRGAHLWRVERNGLAKQVRSRNNYDSREILCMNRDRRGRLWIGSWQGLLRLDHKGWLVESGGPDDAVLSVCDDEREGLWVGTQSSGLWHHSGGDDPKAWRRTEGLPSDTIRLLYRDAEGALWAATPKGLVCLSLRKPRGTEVQGTDKADWAGIPRQLEISQFTREQGLPDDDFRQFMDDGKGHFWLGTRHHILRISRQELTEVASGRRTVLTPQVLGRGDGLEDDLMCGGQGWPLTALTAGGRLWCATYRGIVRLDTQALPTNPADLPVMIESMAIEGQPPLCFNVKEGPADSQGIAVPPGSRDITFTFTAPCYKAPDQILFRTFLDGHDDAWSLPDMARTRQYSRLPPGAYRFRVTATSSDGHWNEAARSVAFIIKPFVWQTAWFMALSGMLALGSAGLGGGLLARRRARRKLEAAKRQASERERVLTREQAVERERSRIARDIHDDLGASLTQIALLSELTKADFADAEVAQEHVEDIFQTARTMTRSVDEIVWAVNPKNDTLEQFGEYLGQFAQDFLRSANVSCRLLFPAEMPTLVMTSALRHNLFLAVKEALKNVVCHSGAGEVSLEVSVDADTLVLVIRDNGCGIAAGAPAGPRPGGGNGLANMRKRMRDIGGTLDICGAEGRGTAVILRVPLDSACRQNCRHDAGEGDAAS